MLYSTKMEEGRLRRSKRLSINEFQRFLRLYISQPWLMPLEPAIVELLDCCDHIDEQFMICDLLDRFTYVANDTFNLFLNDVTEKVINDWKLPGDQTRIVGMSVDYRPDSAEILLYDLQTTFSRKGWGGGGERQFVTHVHRAFKKLDGIESLNIVLVDEFIGSGQTAINRIGMLNNMANNVPHLQDLSVKVCVLAAMEHGKRTVEDLGVEVFSPHVLKKGLSDYLNGQALQKALKRMLRLESLLLDEVRSTKLPSLGYNQAEALYAREAATGTANTPNSVFPVFWWPLDANGSSRNAILHRMIP